VFFLLFIFSYTALSACMPPLHLRGYIEEKKDLKGLGDKKKKKLNCLLIL